MASETTNVASANRHFEHPTRAWDFGLPIEVRADKSVWLDGKDITRYVRNVRLKVDAGEVSQATLVLYVSVKGAGI
jgi:hypothetical protein